MREILFKAKRLDNGQWVFGDLLKTKYEKIVYICYEDSVWKCDGKTVCQYIGLTDKNNIKIFENDIMENKYGETGIVSFGWYYGTFGFFCEGRVNDIQDPNLYVIGNIYDNVQGV